MRVAYKAVVGGGWGGVGAVGATLPLQSFKFKYGQGVVEPQWKNTGTQC